MNKKVGSLPVEGISPRSPLVSHLTAADALLKRGQPDDQRGAERHVREALRIAEALERLTGQGVGHAHEATPGTQPIPPRPLSPPSIFRQEGEFWSISFRHRTFRLKHRVGLSYLALLLAAPDREIHVLDVVAITANHDGPTSAALRFSGDPGPRLDWQAKCAYRERLCALQDELTEAERWQDIERATTIRHEKEMLEEELAAAVGLGGRDRRAAGASERARSSVTKAVRSAIRCIGEHHENLQNHLSRSVRTGTFLSYSPEPDHVPVWQVR